MQNKTEIFAKRLNQARKREKLSMEDLCSKMDCAVTKQAISKYENAQMMPSSSILIELARVLKVNLDFFFRPFEVNDETFEVSFRKKSKMSARDVESLKIQIQDETERYLETEQILGETRNESLLNFQEEGVLSTPADMVRCAQRVRTEWELGTDNIANVQEMLESHGILVIYTQGPEEFFGVSGYINNDRPVIVLNSLQPHIERRRLTALHELCHLLFNKQFDPNLTERQKENLCNSFANELLLPSSVLLSRFRGGGFIALDELDSLAMIYGISIDAIIYKLKELGIINEQRYRWINIHKNQDPHFKERLERSCYEEKTIDHFVPMVYTALARDLITTSKAASLLNTTVDEVLNNYKVI